MSKSSTSSMPGVDAMTDSLEFVKNMWGGMKIPGMAMPTLSVDDINKQITDLKAVESWLTLNMSMLRGTIQALEVQSATIATLQSMSESMTAMIKPPAQEEKSVFETPFSFSGSNGGAAKPEPAPATATEEVAPSSPSAGDPAALAATFVNPAAWWNMLQDQFKQAVNTAMVPEPEAVPARSKAKPAAKRSTAGAASAASRKRKSASKS